MKNPIDHFRERIRRRAILMEIGGFSPPKNAKSSWFGRVGFGLPGETWPTTNKSPMNALCQINLTELPFRPPQLEDLEFISVFIGPSKLPLRNPNGTNWCLRAYRAIDQLVPLPQSGLLSPIEAFPMRPKVIEEDFPCWEDVPDDVPPEADDQYYDLFQNVRGFKLGGWPTLIQCGIGWPLPKVHSVRPEYVFQIDSTERGNWMWGDNGVGYFARATAGGGVDEWALEWQCY